MCLAYKKLPVRNGLFECAKGPIEVDIVNDEDAFRLELPSFAAIRVGRREHSAAPYFLEAQTDNDRLIELLLEGLPS